MTSLLPPDTEGGSHRVHCPGTRRPSPAAPGPPAPGAIRVGLVISGVHPPDENPAIGDVAQTEGQQLGQGGQQHLAVLGRRAAQEETLEEHLVEGPELEVGKAWQVREGRVEQIQRQVSPLVDLGSNIGAA